MQPFTTVHGTAIPFIRPNIDTDVIVRIERLTENERDALEPFAFEALRYAPDGTLDPDCIFNQEAYRNAPILLAGENFGCGSSREGAVWALACLGIRCVVAPSFGGIFANNCFQNGVLTIVLPKEKVREMAGIASADPAAPFSVDLAAKTISPPNEHAVPFEIEALRQSALLQGIDELAMTMKRAEEIKGFQTKDAVARPWIHR